MTPPARVNRVWGVIDRTTNNLLGEFPTRAEADEFFDELLAADHRAGLHVEVVEAERHATPDRAAKWRYLLKWRSREWACRLLGHRYKPLPPPGDYAYMSICDRCKRLQ